MEQGIVLARESLLRSFDYAENIVAGKGSDLEKIYSLMLEYARFETIMMRDQDACLKTQPLVQCVVSLAKPIATARWTDDMKVRFAQINEIMLKLWPYIKAELEKQKQQKKQEKQNQQGDDDSKNPQGNQSEAIPRRKRYRIFWTNSRRYPKIRTSLLTRTGALPPRKLSRIGRPLGLGSNQPVGRRPVQ